MVQCGAEHAPFLHRDSCIRIPEASTDNSAHRHGPYLPKYVDVCSCLKETRGWAKSMAKPPGPVQPIVNIETSDEQNVHAPDDPTPDPPRRIQVKSFTPRISEGADESYVSLPW